MEKLLMEIGSVLNDSTFWSIAMMGLCLKLWGIRWKLVGWYRRIMNWVIGPKDYLTPDERKVPNGYIVAKRKVKDCAYTFYYYEMESGYSYYVGHKIGIEHYGNQYKIHVKQVNESIIASVNNGILPRRIVFFFGEATKSILVQASVSRHVAV